MDERAGTVTRIAGTVRVVAGTLRQIAGDMRQAAGERDTTGMAGLWAVIPAGGAGTRLWPLSRSSSPKFLHDLTGAGSSLLQATWQRLEPLCGDRIMVVAGVLHEAAVRVQLPGLAPGNLIAEPSPRGSMAAIGLAAAILERRDPDAVIGSFAADHVIGEPHVLPAVSVRRSRSHGPAMSSPSVSNRPFRPPVLVIFVSATSS